MRSSASARSSGPGDAGPTGPRGRVQASSRRRTPTARRTRPARSASSRSWLHSIAPCMDRCRGDAVLRSTGEQPNEVSSSAASSSTVSTLVRAAASSIASGMPSSRRTTRADLIDCRPGRARARSPARRTAGPPARRPAVGRRRGSASARYDEHLSPGTLSSSRLDASSDRSGSTPAAPAQIGRRPRRGARSCRARAAVPAADLLGDLLDQPGAVHRMQPDGCGDRRSDARPRRSTAPAAPSRRRPGSCRRAPPPMASASRVLPTPPGPVRVSSRVRR